MLIFLVVRTLFKDKCFLDQHVHLRCGFSSVWWTPMLTFNEYHTKQFSKKWQRERDSGELLH